MKKLLGVLLSASVLTLTACGKQEAPATDAAQNKDSGELQTVTMAGATLPLYLKPSKLALSWM